MVAGLYNIVSYENINEYFSQKLNMTNTVYINNHWTTGWSLFFFTKKNCADQKPKMATTTWHNFTWNLQPYRWYSHRILCYTTSTETWTIEIRHSFSIVGQPLNKWGPLYLPGESDTQLDTAWSYDNKSRRQLPPTPVLLKPSLTRSP
jgi:hypothetical protein